jgi:hypothetical protein
MSVSAPLRRLTGAGAGTCRSLPASSSATLVTNWGRLGAAKQRSTTVNHGAQRTTKAAAGQL